MMPNHSPQGRDGDGWSTVAFAWYASQVGGRLWTVDIDSGALATCRRLTAAYASSVEFVERDSVAFLREWTAVKRGPIHLLYLDSLDCFDHQREASEAHHLAEVEAALPSLARPGLVLLDDTHPAGEPDSAGVPPFSGKGARVVPWLVSQSFRLLWYQDGQALLRGMPPGRQGSRPPSPSREYRKPDATRSCVDSLWEASVQLQLEGLEERLRRAERHLRFLCVALLCAAITLGVLLTSNQGGTAPRGTDVTAPFRVRDRAGRTLLVVEQGYARRPGLTLFGANGKPTVDLGDNGWGGNLVLRDSSRSPRAQLGVMDWGTSFALYDGRGSVKPVVQLSAGQTDGTIALFDDTGFAILELESRASGGSLVIRDRKQQPVFMKP